MAEETVDYTVMRVSEVPLYLETLYFAGAPPILLLGAPGIGKSAVVRTAAELIASKLGRTVIEYNDDKAEEIIRNKDKYFVVVDMRLTEVDPADLIGIPRDVEWIDAVRYRPLLWARVLSQVPGILFLDELTNVQDDMILAAAYKIILDKRVGMIQLNDGVMVVSAGNPPEYSSIARGLPAPLASRMLIAEIAPPSVEDWLEYIRSLRQRGVKIDERLIETMEKFFKKHPDLFIKVPSEPEVLKSYPVPRSWHRLVELLSRVPKKYWGYVVFQAVGEEAGHAFWEFLKVRLDPEEFIRDPSKFDELSDSERSKIAIDLANMINKNGVGEVDRMDRLLYKMAKEYPEIFMQFLASIKSLENRKMTLVKLFDKHKDIKDKLIRVIGGGR